MTNKLNQNQFYYNMQNLKTSIITYLLIILVVTAFSQSVNKPVALSVNQQRIENRIFELAKFGKDSLGRGYRVAYTRGDIEGRAWFIGLMKKAGLEVTIDFAGNIIGKRKGKKASNKSIAFGSHIDMVPDGGNYDGCLGSIAALEMIEVLNENNIVTENPLEVIVFSDEEGGPTGSLAMSGHLTAEDLKQVSQSKLTVGNGIKAIGGNPDSIVFAPRKKGEIKAYLELHIEQGGILENEKINIGVVQGIVGIVDWEVTVNGMANHAGTTPMKLRKDALLAASKLVIAVNEVINSYEGNQVANIGKISAYPGAFNVVPGKVIMALEIRDLSSDKIMQLFRDIEKRAAAIALASGTTITFNQPIVKVKPALTDKKLQELIAANAKVLGFTTKLMQSGAGHDAQDMALITSVGMIFIPSVGGISHSPKEFSTAKDMANGANVLLQTILMLDKE